MARTEESFLDLGTNLDDIAEATTVADGEYQIQITDLGITESEKGKYLIPKFDVVGVESSKTFTNPLRIPDDTMDAKEKQRRLRALKHFYKCFDIPGTGQIVFSEQIGKTGWAVLGETEDAKYGKQNRVVSFSVRKD